eukprot:5371575-Prymnesium_polylepis.1
MRRAREEQLEALQADYAAQVAAITVAQRRKRQLTESILKLQAVMDGGLPDSADEMEDDEGEEGALELLE